MRSSPAPGLVPDFPKTRKGTVAHLGADAAAVARRGEPALPGAVILPKWPAGSATRLEAMEPERLFPALAFDLHHNILPPIAHTRVDAGLLLQRLQPSKWPAWQVLHPIDQVLHSASHLFQDSEARDRVRDLIDLDGLLRHFGQAPGFWDELPERARELGLAEPLALASHFCVRWLGTPAPPATLASIEAIGPSRLRRAWLLPTLSSLLMPTATGRAAPWHQDMAAVLFLARYHRNRMPMRLLVPHLWHKLRPRRLGEAEGDAGA